MATHEDSHDLVKMEDKFQLGYFQLLNLFLQIWSFVSNPADLTLFFLLMYLCPYFIPCLCPIVTAILTVNWWIKIFAQFDGKTASNKFVQNGELQL